MSVIPAKLKCDQCGTVASYKDTEDWLKITVGRDMGSFFGAARGLADLCSWPCLSDYALTHALDRA